MNGVKDGIFDCPYPILSRAFQELSRGVVTATDAKKLNEIPFPFPYVQMIQVMLLIHFISTPLIISMLVPNIVWGTAMAFVATFSLWSINFIGAEIEMPFGDDSNDLPVKEMQIQLNKSLWGLIDEGTRWP